MRFSELLSWVPRVEAELARSYDAEARRAPGFRSYTSTLKGFSLRGGKRLRALLLLAGYHLATGRSPAPVLPAAAALEHFQSWMLVHDDIIDHANVRRGAATVHRLLEREHDRLHRAGNREEYGVGMGITLGDLEEPYTVRGLLSVRVSGEYRLAALEEYGRMTTETAYGQLLDIRLAGLPVARVRERDVLEVHRLKTSIYTVSSPLRIGAILGAARARLLEELDQIGADFGVAFQLRDDVLGAGLGPDPTEKSANDLREGKRTLLVVKAWRASDRSGRKALERELRSAHRSAASVRALQRRIRESGSLAHSERRIEDLTRRAKQRIQSSRVLSGSGRRLLEEIGDRLVHRAR
ncbi:MAG: polyprenyl synthetase family protein [Thermoplasmata archaeon]|nr:polyprenyl synthetase family protein [Thermoplasmata archaeon]